VVGTVHETGTCGERRQLAGHLAHRTIPDMHTFLRKIDHYTTLEGDPVFRARGGHSGRSTSPSAALETSSSSTSASRVPRRLEGLDLLRTLGGLGAVRHWKHRELIKAGGGLVTGTHDALRRRPVRRVGGPVQDEVPPDDVRVRAILAT